MQQLYLTEHGQLEWREIAEPKLPPGGALVRPTAVAACDLDVGLVTGAFPMAGPLALGHEFLGRIEATDGEFPEGERVIVSFQICCGTCDRCTRGITGSCREVREGAMYGLGSVGGEEWGGAFSDLVAVPYQFMMRPLPEGIEEAALASANDNLSDAYRTVVPHLEAAPEADVLIIGGGGRSIGLFAVMMAVAAGAGKVDYVDLSHQRLEMAESLGANPFQGPPPLKMGRYQVTVDASSQPEGLACALRSTDSEGVCTSIGIYFEDPQIPFINMYTRGITFKTGRPHSRALIPKVLEIVASKAIDPMKIQTVVDWEDLPEALGDPPTKLVATRSP